MSQPTTPPSERRLGRRPAGGTPRGAAAPVVGLWADHTDRKLRWQLTTVLVTWIFFSLLGVAFWAPGLAKADQGTGARVAACALGGIAAHAAAVWIRARRVTPAPGATRSGLQSIPWTIGAVALASLGLYLLGIVPQHLLAP